MDRPGAYGVASPATIPIISKVLSVANPDTGWKPMLHSTARGWLWVRGTPLRKHFERSLNNPESNVA